MSERIGVGSADAAEGAIVNQAGTFLQLNAMHPADLREFDLEFRRANSSPPTRIGPSACRRGGAFHENM